MTSHPSGEILGLDQSIAYAEQIAQLAAEHAPAGNEGYLAHLARSHVDGAGLVTARQMQDAFAAAQAAATQHAGELAKQKTVQAAYDQNPDAGDKDYHQADAGAAAQPAETHTEPKRTPVTADHAADQAARQPAAVTGHVPQAAHEDPTGRVASEEIPPQWPGHTPHRRWEWKACAHRPGDRRHVQVALPSVDLASEPALHAYVQDAFKLYDWVELLHWYSGTELTFTRQSNGPAHVTRRQLQPTDGSPLRAAYDAANPWTRSR